MSQATSPPSSTLTDLTLHVRQEGAPEQEVFLQHGLSIGRNASNTICIDHPEVDRIHAQILRRADGKMLLECVSEQLTVALPDGTKVNSIELHPGSTFKIGKATVRCLKHQTKATVVVADSPWQVRCPRCHEVIANLAHDATHCPRCNAEIQYIKPADPAAEGSAESFVGWLPKQVGPYRIRAFVAQGGMGIVLRGLHNQTDALAAVKLLKIDPVNDPSWRARFMAEIDTLQTLRHPNVVRLQAHGQDERMLWLAMDWIDGAPLSKWAAKIRGGGQNVPIDQIRQVMVQVVNGLLYLHGKGIIHRDLKPSNILLAQDDSVKMVDFGIARSSSGQTGVVTQLTRTGMIAGTESYMSPEQGEGRPLTGASDVYSLAVIWYELITGRRPVGAYVAPSMLRGDCPPQWSSAIGACLSVDPRMRPTPEAILASLSGTAAPVPVPPPITGFGPAHPPVHPHAPVHPQPPYPHPPVPPTPWPAPQPHYPGPAPAGPGAGATAAQLWQKAKTRGVELYRKYPAQYWLARMGPAGAWIQSHKKESIGIGVALLIVLVVIIVRSTASDPTPAASNAGAGNAGGDNKAGVATPNTAVTPQQAQEMYERGVGMYMAAQATGDQAKAAQAVVLLTKSAEAGNKDAMFALANYYGEQGAPHFDYNKMVFWLRKSAQAGHP